MYIELLSGRDCMHRTKNTYFAEVNGIIHGEFLKIYCWTRMHL